MITTGVRRLDTMLGGGLPDKSAALLYGPSFMGKEQLAQQAAVANAAAGVPVLFITTNATADGVRKKLMRLDPALPERERDGLLYYIDTYSVAIGAHDTCPNATYLDSTVDLNDLSVAINHVEKGIVAAHERHLIILDSLSTIVAASDAQTVFRFLQVFIGRTRLAGATHLALMDSGMHSDPELQMFKHLMTGVVTLRDHQGKPQVMVEGLGTGSTKTWVEYRFDDTGLEVTGSFAAGRI